jgi:hypothetical protein
MSLGGYVDGFNFYAVYFINGMDPSGMKSTDSSESNKIKCWARTRACYYRIP